MPQSVYLRIMEINGVVNLFHLLQFLSLFNPKVFPDALGYGPPINLLRNLLKTFELKVDNKGYVSFDNIIWLDLIFLSNRVDQLFHSIAQQLSWGVP